MPWRYKTNTQPLEEERLNVGLPLVLLVVLLLLLVFVVLLVLEGWSSQAPSRPSPVGMEKETPWTDNWHLFHISSRHHRPEGPQPQGKIEELLLCVLVESDSPDLYLIYFAKIALSDQFPLPPRLLLSCCRLTSLWPNSGAGVTPHAAISNPRLEGPVKRRWISVQPISENVNHTNRRVTNCNPYFWYARQNEDGQKAFFKQLIKSTPGQEEQVTSGKWKQGWFPWWWRWRTRPLRRTNSNLPTPRNFNFNWKDSSEYDHDQQRRKREMRVTQRDLWKNKKN